VFSLVIKSGPLAGRRLELDRQLVVGRGEADVTIVDPRISRRHAVFRPVSGGLEVEDLGSSNGTRVNGERIAAVTRLGPGDMVELGGTVIEVELELPPAPAADDGGGSPAGLPTQIAPGARAVPEATPEIDRAEEADELRPVTALFADVVGSTTLGERLTPEEVKALIGECVSRMARAVEQFGGVIDAFMGDGIAAFFGVPTAHEDDPERAARAALQIVDTVGEYARDIQAAWGIADFNVRVGLNSGPVAVGTVGGAKRQSVALGDTANVAARLQGVADPGSVAVGELTAKQLAQSFELEPLGDVTVKGRAEAIPVSRLGRPLRGSWAPAATPLVGRDAEVARLTAARDDLLSGRGQVLLVLGDAGIGKTRLLSELRALAGEGVTWLEGNCQSYGREFPLLPAVETLRGWLGVEEGDAPLAAQTRLRIKLEGLFGDRLQSSLPPLEALLSGGPAGLGTPGEDLGADARGAYCAWLEALTELRPVALVLEDFQWADPWTCALANDLLEIVDRAPLLLATSFRIAPGSEGWQFRVHVLTEHPHRALELPLGPLSEADASTLLSTLMAAGLADETRAEIVKRAEGNPLYLEQLLRALVENGDVERRRNWTLSPSATRLVPAALESLLLSRIDNLPQEARQLAQVVAVIGRSFSLDLLRRVYPSQSADEDMRTLVRAGIFRELRRYPVLEYSFTHGLLREAALSTLTRARRRELYGRVAAGLEELYADTIEEHLDQLAHYYGRSDDLRKALGYLERAGEKALGLDARFQAAELFRRAERLAGELGDTETQTRLAERLSALGDQPA
jgi:class 3 adenylate cyclase